jgi:hypothetical protein
MKIFGFFYGKLHRSYTEVTPKLHREVTPPTLRFYAGLRGSYTEVTPSYTEKVV